MNRTGIVCVSLAVALTIVGGLAWADIEGSKHDFSDEAWTEGDPCAACHAPDRDEPPEGAPLWNSAADLTRRPSSKASGDLYAPKSPASFAGGSKNGAIRLHASPAPGSTPLAVADIETAATRAARKPTIPPADGQVPSISSKHRFGLIRIP